MSYRVTKVHVFDEAVVVVVKGNILSPSDRSRVATIWFKPEDIDDPMAWEGKTFDGHIVAKELVSKKPGSFFNLVKRVNEDANEMTLFQVFNQDMESLGFKQRVYNVVPEYEKDERLDRSLIVEEVTQTIDYWEERFNLEYGDDPVEEAAEVVAAAAKSSRRGK